MPCKSRDMRNGLRISLLLAVVLGNLTFAWAQAPAPKKPAPSPWREHCQPNDGFCFQYPPAWSVLGEIFDGNGVVVAPPQKQDQAAWDQVTVALVIPAPQGDEEPISIDQAIAQAVSSVREGGQSFETLQRQQRTVDAKPAQLLRLRYTEKASQREWIEELVFIQGPELEIYSVALKCSPLSCARLEPTFSRIVGSWRLPEPEPPPEDAGASPQKPRAPAPKPPAKVPAAPKS